MQLIYNINVETDDFTLRTCHKLLMFHNLLKLELVVN